MDVKQWDGERAGWGERKLLSPGTPPHHITEVPPHHRHAQQWLRPENYEDEQRAKSAVLEPGHCTEQGEAREYLDIPPEEEHYPSAFPPASQA